MTTYSTHVKKAFSSQSTLIDKGVSCWRCKGWKQGGGALEWWHITSTNIHPASFPLLNTIIKRPFTYAVAFHSFQEEVILISGGADNRLKQEIKTTIENAIADSNIKVEIAEPLSHYNGDNPKNIVNRLANGSGIQVEQSLEARQNYWQQITDAVVSMYNTKI